MICGVYIILGSEEYDLSSPKSKSWARLALNKTKSFMGSVQVLSRTASLLQNVNVRYYSLKCMVEFCVLGFMIWGILGLRYRVWCIWCIGFGVWDYTVQGYMVWGILVILFTMQASCIEIFKTMKLCLKS